MPRPMGGGGPGLGFVNESLPPDLAALRAKQDAAAAAAEEAAAAAQQQQQQQASELARRIQLQSYGAEMPPPVAAAHVATPAPTPAQLAVKAAQSAQQEIPAKPKMSPDQAMGEQMGALRSLSKRAFNPAESMPPEPGGVMVDGLGGGMPRMSALSGDQRALYDAARGGIEDRYAHDRARTEEEAAANDPMTKMLQAQAKNSAYESMMPADATSALFDFTGATGKPAQHGSFRREIDPKTGAEVIRNNPTSGVTRGDQRALTLARANAGIQADALSGKDEAKYRALDSLFDSEAERDLQTLRKTPEYLSAPADRKAAAEQQVKAEAGKRKVQARLVGLAGNFPSASAAQIE